MRIAINGLSAVNGGNVTYLKNIIASFTKLYPEHQFIVLLTKINQEQIVGEIKQSKNLQVIVFNLPSLPLRLIFEQLCLPIIALRLKADIFFAPANIIPIFLPTKSVLLIQSINPFLDFSQRRPYQILRIKTLNFLCRLSIKKATAIIFLSHYSKRLINQKIKVQAKNTIIYPGIKTLNLNKKIKPLIKKKYILSVSNIEFHKNFEVLIKAYANLKTTIRKKYNLIIVGNQQKKEIKYYLFLKKLINQLKLKKEIKIIQGLEGKEIWPYYRHASLFVFPSMAESFGFPPLEAMAAEIPIISSNATAIPEVLTDAAIFFNPKNNQELTQKIKLVLENQRIKQMLIAKGTKQLKKFSWKKAAQKTMTIFKEINQE